jgi:hypothetical protein
MEKSHLVSKKIFFSFLKMVSIDLLASINRTNVLEVSVNDAGSRILVTYLPGSPNMAELFSVVRNTITSVTTIPFVANLPGEQLLDAVPDVENAQIAILTAVPPVVPPAKTELYVYLLNLSGTVLAQTTLPTLIYFDANGDYHADAAFSKNGGILTIAYNTDEHEKFHLASLAVPTLAFIDDDEDNGLVFQVVPFTMACKKSYASVIVRHPTVPAVPGSVVGNPGSTSLHIYTIPFAKYGSLSIKGAVEEVSELTLPGVNPYGISGVTLNDHKTEALLAFSAYNVPSQSGIPYPIYTAIFKDDDLELTTRTTFMSEAYVVQPLYVNCKVQFIIEANVPAAFSSLGIYKQTKNCDCVSFRPTSQVVTLPGTNLPSTVDSAPFDLNGRFITVATDTVLQIYAICE